MSKPDPFGPQEDTFLKDIQDVDEWHRPQAVLESVARKRARTEAMRAQLDANGRRKVQP